MTKTKNSVTNTAKEMKHHTLGGNIRTSHTDKGLASKIHTQRMHTDNRMTNNPIKMSKTPEQASHQSRHRDGKQVCRQETANSKEMKHCGE